MRSPAARLRNLTKLGVVPDDEPAPPHEMQYTLQQVMQWNEQRVCQWVREQGFGKYEEAFHEQQVNGEALVELDYGLLKELSVRTVGERVRLNLAIRRLRQQCLHMDVDMDMGNGANPRNKRSVTLGSMPGVGGFAPHSAMELVASPGPLSATTVASMGMAAEPTLVGAFGLVPPFLTSAGARKELPILPRASMSSNSIGLSEVGESSGSGSSSSSSGGGGSGSARPSGNGNSILQRSNTDTRAFGAREHTHELISATVRKQKTAGGGPHRHTQQITPPHKTGGGAPAAVPLSAPVPRLRAQAGSQRAQKPGQGGDIERLGFQLQEFFGTDISVAHLADSLSVRTWQITIAGPENQVRQVQIANTNSAKAILDRVRRAFDLDNEIDGDQYSLFSMTSEGGGARCLTNEELSKMFSDPDSTPPEKFFLRKRHQLSRPPMGTKRSEHLQRAIERLGNIIPAASAQIPPPPPLHQLLLRPLTKWESTTEKLTKILGERPPSELVSMNVEKYFPGNEARARHSIMRRRKNESQEAAGPDGQDSTGRSSRRQSRANRRSSNTSARSMQARIRSLTLGSEERWSGFSNNLEPIKESLQSPAAPGLATPAPPPAAPEEPAASVDEAAAAAPAEAGAPDGDEQASRAIVTSPPPVSPNGSCASLQFSDDEDSRSGSDDDHNMGTLSDLSDSGLSDSFDDDSSFCNSLRDSDIYGDEDLATYDSELR
ncbi:ATP binding, partial [Coemansia biformis]